MKSKVQLRPLTAAEFRLMDALWDLGRGSVAEVAEAIRDKRLAYTTVQTTLRVLEKKGYVKHEQSGRTHIFVPAVDRDAARSNVLQHVRHAFFAGSAGALLMHLVRNERLSASDRAKLAHLLKKEHLA